MELQTEKLTEIVYALSYIDRSAKILIFRILKHQFRGTLQLMFITKDCAYDE